MSGAPPPGAAVQWRHLVPGAKHVFAVASGKGGVGKSSVAVNLAVAFGKIGCTAGLLDGDIYGPSTPQMLGTQAAPLTMIGEQLIPIERFGIKTMSIGNLVPASQAAIWRGPMLHQAVQRLMSGVKWGELDVLVIDLPPGTGDVHLSMMQSVKVDGAVIVTTPQKVATADVRKCIDMFQKVKIPIIGVVENMSYLDCRCGERHHLFGQGGAHELCAELGLEFLGAIPMLPDVMKSGEAGVPYASQDTDERFSSLAKTILKK